MQYVSVLLYTICMKVLIAPNILFPREGTAYYLTRSLLDLFHEHNDTIALSADKDNGFRNASLYPFAEPRRPYFNGSADNRSYEEYLYSCGVLGKKYLQEDTELLQEAIAHFKPDWVIGIDRTAAMIAARAAGTPCAVFVNAAMYRNAYFPAKCLRGLNEVLSSLQFEQVFDIKTLLDGCAVRFMFGHENVHPLMRDTSVIRLKAMMPSPRASNSRSRTAVALHEFNDTPGSTYRLLSEAFKGSPYQFYVSFHGVHILTEENMHYVDMSRKNIVDASMLVIHDGSEFLFHECMAKGVPQLVIASHEYPRLYFGQAVRRCGVGDYIAEEDAEVSSVYEGFRKIISDARYTGQADLYRKLYARVPDFKELRTVLINSR